MGRVSLIISMARPLLATFGDNDNACYRLEQPTLGVVEAFFGYICPKTERIWMKPGMWGVTVRTHTKIRGKSHQGFHPRMPKRVLFFWNQYNADFLPLILHQFWPLLKYKTWIGLRMRRLTPVKNFRISATSQHGFRNGKSCLTNLLVFLYKVRPYCRPIYWWRL